MSNQITLNLAAISGLVDFGFISVARTTAFDPEQSLGAVCEKRPKKLKTIHPLGHR